MFIFRMFRAIGGYVVDRLRRKSVLFFIGWFLFSNLDAMWAGASGRWLVIGLVVLPPVLLWLWAQARYTFDGGVDEFLFATRYMIFGGLLGLLRAWSAAAGGSLPDTLTSVLRILLGTHGSAAVSAAAEAVGLGAYSPLPLLHPDGWVVQVMALDPVLILVSIGVLGMAAHSFWFALVEYGGSKPQQTNDIKEARMMRILRSHRATWTLINPLSHARRLMANLFRVPCIGPDQLVVGIDEVRLADPLAGLLRFPGRILSWMGWHTHLTPFDPRSLVVASCEGSALLVGGAGSGKTQGWEMANQATLNAPMIIFQTQGNAAEQEIPLRQALGRTPYLFDARLRRASASIQALAVLDPAAPDFFETCGRYAQTQIEDSPNGEHGDLKDRAKALIAVTLSGNVWEGRAAGRVATMFDVYDDLCSTDLIGRLRYWADEGPEDFRHDALVLANDMDADPQLMASLRFFIGQMRWLASPSLRALVCGGTDLVVDPDDLVGDRARCDWVLQTTSPQLARGLWRLLITVALEPHIRRTAAKARCAPRTTLMVGETFALGPFPLLGEIFVLHRQKGVRAVLLGQSTGQWDKLYGSGTFEEWCRSAHVVGFTQFNEVAYANQVEAMAGETAQLESDRLNSPGGGLSGSSKRWGVTPLLNKNRLMRLSRFMGVVFVNDRRGRRRTLLARMPVHFLHPSLGRLVRGATPEVQARSHDGQLLSRPPELSPGGSDAPLLIENKEADDAQTLPT